MDRRAFLTGVIAGGLLAAPLAAEGQQPRGKTWRVGFLSGSARPPDDAVPFSLRQALRELGYVEQQNVVYLGRVSSPCSFRYRQMAPAALSISACISYLPSSLG